MEAQEGPAAPASGNPPHPGLSLVGEREDLDPEIEALLDFEPVPRKIKVKGGWTPEKQRAFIARLAVHGSIGKAVAEVAMERTGVMKLYNSPEGGSFRSAWHDAIELAERRRAERFAGGDPIGDPPSVDNRRKYPAPSGEGPLPGQVMNEFAEWEDEDSVMQRAEEARDSIRMKLLRIRRLYLAEISACPGKRAAFEILTELPIDWDKAEKGEPQDDEPWNRANQRQPDMILTAESGWSFGEAGYGPDKLAAAREAVDAYRAEQGLPPVEWDGD